MLGFPLSGVTISPRRPEDATIRVAKARERDSRGRGWFRRSFYGVLLLDKETRGRIAKFRGHQLGRFVPSSMQRPPSAFRAADRTLGSEE